MFLISLDWLRPADGVEVVEGTVAYPKLLTDDLFIRGRTARTSPLAIRLRDLENPISIRLINSRSVDDLSTFVSRHGCLQRLGYNHDGTGEFVRILEAARDVLEEGFALTNDADDTRRAFWADEHLKTSCFYPAFEYDDNDRRQRLTWKPSTLADLMVAEVAFALETGAKFQRCEHCGNAFLTGHLTGRRATAVYCCDKCRVAALRVRNLAKGGNNGRQKA